MLNKQAAKATKCKRMQKTHMKKLLVLINPVTPTVVIWVLAIKRQSARMSKITNDGLTRSGIRCFIAVGYS